MKLFAVFFVATIFSSTFRIEANAAQRTARVGLLIPESGPNESQTVKGLKDRLKELGYVEGEGLTLELKDMKGDRSALKPSESGAANPRDPSDTVALSAFIVLVMVVFLSAFSSCVAAIHPHGLQG